jgi:hypothetical protein
MVIGYWLLVIQQFLRNAQKISNYIFKMRVFD